MSVPQRIQQRRTRGWRMPLNAKSVARPSRWGNPYRVHPWGGEWVVAEHGTEHGYLGRDATKAIASRIAVELFDEWIPEHWYGRRGLVAIELRGLDLACWCALDQPCHADVLLKLANT